MLIEPNTNIRLLHNVPLDNTYEHTVYFRYPNDQYNYFAGLTKYNLMNQSYQRVNRGRARVGFKADDIYDCNYMMFQNTSFGSKWFYAFITSVEYVNNVTSEITFEMDVMQTWWFDFTSENCFVEREHVTDDAIGNHIEAEPVGLGEYVMNDYTGLYYNVNGTTLRSNSLATVIAVNSAGEDGTQASTGNVYDGIYGGAQLFAYSAVLPQAINSFLSDFKQNPDNIIAVYTVPVLALPNHTIPSDHVVPGQLYSTGLTASAEAVNTGMTLNGYKPKNNKLYTYPYNFYHVDNASGGGLSLRYEFFANHIPTFNARVTVTQPVQMNIRPTNYKGSGGDTLNTETLSLSGYPLCSWNYDAYQAWMAQNNIPIAIGLGQSIAGTALNVASGNPNPIGIANNMVGNVANVTTQIYRASIASDIMKGSQNNGNINCTSEHQQFYGGRCSVNAQQARIIDDFFTMFGYGIKRVKTPNISARPHWNYVKTVGWCGKGSVPADDMRKIANIYDNGITFWRNGNEVGNYSLDNSMQ